MAAKKTEDTKIILEREYIIPLRRTWLKVPEYKRGKKAVKAIKLFLVRHMKVYDRDIRKIKIESVETKEKEEAAKEENLKLAKEQAREKKHVSKVEEERIQRKALAK